jgi:membrane-associated phospholipid phosphatase
MKRLTLIGIVLLAVAIRPSAVSLATGGTAPSAAKSWQPWIISSVGDFRVGPPPRRHSSTTRRELRKIMRLQGHLSKKRLKVIKRWNRPAATLPWTEVALDMILIHRPAAFPTRSARLLGLLHTGMYDAMAAALDSRAAYRRKPPFKVDVRIERLAKARDRSYPDINAAIAGAAERILAYVFPQEPSSTFTRLADQAISSRVWAGVAYPSDVDQGRLIGQRVAEVVINYGEGDGHKNPPDPVLATRTCDPADCNDPNQTNWVPTPFHYQYPPTDPAASTWKTYLLSSPSQFRPPLPYGYGSPEFCTELEEAYDTNNTAEDGLRQLAFFWDDGPGTFSPAGHWNDIAVDVLRNRKLGTKRAAFIFSVMNAAIVDAFVAVWDAKYTYWTQRPVTAVRERPSVCGGQVYDPAWLPNIVTPPFPAFPSGHSGESAAAARVLQFFFPDKGQDPTTLVGNYGSAGSFDAVADEVAFSRMVGGIHFRVDNEVGLVIGRRIADLAIGWAQANGVGPAGRAPAQRRASASLG